MKIVDAELNADNKQHVNGEMMYKVVELNVNHEFDEQSRS